MAAPSGEYKLRCELLGHQDDVSCDLGPSWVWLLEGGGALCSERASLLLGSPASPLPLLTF